MGRPSRTRALISVDEIASAGMFITLTCGFRVGASASNAAISYPGRVAAMK